MSRETAEIAEGRDAPIDGGLCVLDIRGAWPERGHQAAKLFGGIKAERIFAVLKQDVGRKLAANFREFLRRPLLLVGHEFGEPVVDLVNSLKSLEMTQ